MPDFLVPLHHATAQAVSFRLGVRHCCQQYFLTLLVFAVLHCLFRGTFTVKSSLSLRLYAYTAHINWIRSYTSTHTCTARWLASDLTTVIIWGIQQLTSHYKRENEKKKMFLKRDKSSVCHLSCNGQYFLAVWLCFMAHTGGLVPETEWQWTDALSEGERRKGNKKR